MPQLSFASLTPKTKNIRSEIFLKEIITTDKVKFTLIMP